MVFKVFQEEEEEKEEDFHLSTTTPPPLESPEPTTQTIESPLNLGLEPSENSQSSSKSPVSVSQDGSFKAVQDGDEVLSSSSSKLNLPLANEEGQISTLNAPSAPPKKEQEQGVVESVVTLATLLPLPLSPAGHKRSLEETPANNSHSKLIDSKKSALLDAENKENWDSDAKLYSNERQPKKHRLNSAKKTGRVPLADITSSYHKRAFKVDRRGGPDDQNTLTESYTNSSNIRAPALSSFSLSNTVSSGHLKKSELKQTSATLSFKPPHAGLEREGSASLSSSSSSTSGGKGSKSSVLMMR